MKRIYLTVASVTVLMAGCNKTNQAAKSPEEVPIAAEAEAKVPVKVLAIESRPYKEYGEYYGTVRGIKEANLISYAGGRVTAITANIGDTVKKGQKLCTIDGEKLEVAYKSALLAERIAKENFDRAQVHLKRGSTSRLNADRAELEYLQAKSNRASAEKSYQGAHCISPIEGTVVAKHIDVYQDLTAGQATISVAKLDQVKIEIGVPESAIDGYTIGNQVEVRMTSYPEKTWTGKVVSVSQSVNESDRTIDLEVSVDNEDHVLKPGLTARARILRYDLPTSVAIPTESILTKADGRLVMVADGNVARARKIQVKSSNETQSLIESGLEPGDRLIVKGQAIAVDGSPIAIVD